jgi:hypothetical protein
MSLVASLEKDVQGKYSGPRHPPPPAFGHLLPPEEKGSFVLALRVNRNAWKFDFELRTIPPRDYTESRPKTFRSSTLSD